MLYGETITETFDYLTKPKPLSHLQAVALSSDLAELNKHIRSACDTIEIKVGSLHRT